MTIKSYHQKRNIFQRLPSRLSRQLKQFYHRFLKLRGSSRQVSLGIALGVFVGMTPFLGFHTAIAILLASLFKWSKIAAAVGVLITNPITAPLIYPLTYQLGSMLTGFSEPIQWSRLLEPAAFIALLKNSPMIIIDMLVGGILVGIPLSIIVYFITHAAVDKAKKRIEMKKAQRRLKKQDQSLAKASSVLKKSGHTEKKRNHMSSIVTKGNTIVLNDIVCNQRPPISDKNAQRAGAVSK